MALAFQTHPWVVADTRSNCLTIFVSNQPQGVAEIRGCLCPDFCLDIRAVDRFGEYPWMKPINS